MKRIPMLITAVTAVVTMAVYPLVAESVLPIVYVQVSACALIPVALWLFDRFICPLPLGVHGAVAVQVVAASFFGSALQGYRLISWWDLLMHGLFGITAAVTLFALLGDKVMRGWRTLTVTLSVMGLAALWEAFEFVADLTVGGDAQRVAAALAAGTSPIEDTMTDILITLAGVAIWAVAHRVQQKKRDA